MKILILVIIFASLTALPAPANASEQVPERNCPETYRVVRGDWLSIIANRCGLTVQDLMEANPEITNPARIYVGQTIRIPGGAAVEAAAPQAPEKAATQVALSVQTQASLFHNDMEPEMISSLAEQAAPEPVLLVYTIKQGDRLSSIARRNSTSVAAILDFNPDIQNPHRIFTGQKINIPPAGHVPSQDALSRVGSAPVPPSSEASIPKGLKPGERWVDVNLTTQTVHAYEGETLVRSFLVSTGRQNTPTVTGQYRIYIKLEKTDMRGPGYHLKDVPFTMYFFRGYGFHGTYWHNNFGTPMSHGCVNMATPDAEWLFNFADVGTLVSVRY
jgi:lipoprotein-anchoring transpeptidase ErfK/SrfK